jgi:hypothetical protein
LEPTRPRNHCAHCGTPYPAGGRFCEACGHALPPNWPGPSLFHAEDGADLGVGIELGAATLALQRRSGCALWFLGLLMTFSVVAAVAGTVVYQIQDYREMVPVELLVVSWVEALILMALWLWSRWQPFAASIAALFILLTSSTVTVAANLGLLNGPMRTAFYSQLFVHALFILLLVVVVRSSRNPHGRSKLATGLARHPEPLAAPSAKLRTSTAAQPGSPLTRAVMHWVDSLTSSAQRAVRRVASSPEWPDRIGARAFQVATLVAIITQLHRASTLLTGPSRRFSPVVYPLSSATWLTAWCDGLTSVLAAYIMVKGLVELLGRPGENRDYWLHWLPRGAAMWAGLAALRVGVSIHSMVIGTFELQNLSAAFFGLLAADVAKAALCLLAARFWRRGTVRASDRSARIRDPGSSVDPLREEFGEHEGEPYKGGDEKGEPQQGDQGSE